MSNSDDEVKNIIDRGFYYMVFQPVLDISSCAFFRFEALMRGPEGSAIQNPGKIFNASGYISTKLIHALDMACINLAIRSGRSICDKSKLFLNIHGISLRKLSKNKKIFFPSSIDVE